MGPKCKWQIIDNGRAGRRAQAINSAQRKQGPLSTSNRSRWPAGRPTLPTFVGAPPARQVSLSAPTTGRPVTSSEGQLHNDIIVISFAAQATDMERKPQPFGGSRAARPGQLLAVGRARLPASLSRRDADSDERWREANWSLKWASGGEERSEWHRFASARLAALICD